MREDDHGRSEVPVWRVSQRVAGALDGCPGDIVSVDAERGTFTVEWLDASGSGVSVVIYPEDTIMVRRCMPWET